MKALSKILIFVFFISLFSTTTSCVVFSPNLEYRAPKERVWYTKRIRPTHKVKAHSFKKHDKPMKLEGLDKKKKKKR